MCKNMQGFKDLLKYMLFLASFLQLTYPRFLYVVVNHEIVVASFFKMRLSQSQMYFIVHA